MIKKISFPLSELEQLKNRSFIITTRVSKEYNRYHLGDILKSPWSDLYYVQKIEKINCIDDHPYYDELTNDQIQLISKYKKIDILTLKKL